SILFPYTTLFRSQSGAVFHTAGILLFSALNSSDHIPIFLYWRLEEDAQHNYLTQSVWLLGSTAERWNEIKKISCLHRPLFKVRMALHIELADAVIDRCQSKAIVQIVHCPVHSPDLGIFPKEQLSLRSHIEFGSTQDNSPELFAPIFIIAEHGKHFLQAVTQHVGIQIRQARRAEGKRKSLFLLSLKTDVAKVFVRLFAVAAQAVTNLLGGLGKFPRHLPRIIGPC